MSCAATLRQSGGSIILSIPKSIAKGIELRPNVVKRYRGFGVAAPRPVE